MEAVCILGSPKAQGNTAKVCSKIIQALEEYKVNVKQYCLGDTTIKCCIGCKSCYKNGKCAHKRDDAQIIVEGIFKSNLVIMASPSYWGDVTGQMKAFIDRCTPHCNTNPARLPTPDGIKGVAVAVRAGQNKKENENLIHTFEHFLGHLNIPLVSGFTVEGIDTAQDLEKRPEVLKMAYDFGKSLVALL